MKTEQDIVNLHTTPILRPPANMDLTRDDSNRPHLDEGEHVEFAAAPKKPGNSMIENAAPPAAEGRARALQRQRQRRATRPRIDFYPSVQAVRLIDSLRHRSIGGDASSIINRALIEWEASGILSGPKVRATSRAPG